MEFERVVPASGNPQVAGKQFWPGPARSGVTVTFWASTGVIMIAGRKIALGRIHAGKVVTVHVAAETVTIELDSTTRTVR